MAAQLELSESQRLFARSTFPFPAYVGGFGSGKTFAGVVRITSLQTQFKGVPMGYYLPTYSLVEDVAMPQFAELLDFWSIRHRILKGRAPYIDLPDYESRIILRTYEKPERIIGYAVGHSVVDEIDTLQPEKAKAVWNKVIARNRKKHGIRNSCAVVTTPEGFRFTYERWQKEKREGFRLYRGRTRDNAKHLPTNYIPDLEANYPANLLQAYLEGLFVNLTSGAVYAEFDRQLNGCRTSIAEREPLHIGMDFNVGKMAAVVHVLRDGDPHAAHEFTGLLDTPAMILAIKKQFKVTGKEHPVIVYPDASGDSRKSQNASETDIALLKQAGFSVFVNPGNPAVRDRVLAMNSMIHAGGRRRYKVNTDACPHLTEALEKQCYDKNGEPDKSAGFDHVNDGATYYVCYKFPVVKPVAVVTQLRM